MRMAPNTSNTNPITIRSAGKPTNSSIQELANIVKESGRNPAQRDTFFKILKKF